MTARQVWEGMLTELSKVNAPSMLLQDFNYFFNKAINQYINKRYNIYDISQQSTDDLRVLKATSVLDVNKSEGKAPFNVLSNLGAGKSKLLGATYEVDLPPDYLHILNCVCIYRVNKNWKCYNAGDYVQFSAKRLTADSWSVIVNDYYNRPLPERPYFYIHNVNLNEQLPTNPLNTNNPNGTDLNDKYNVEPSDITVRYIKMQGGLGVEYYVKGTTVYTNKECTQPAEGITLGQLEAQYVSVPNDNNKSNFPREISFNNTTIDAVEKETAQRYGNASKVRMEIRYGHDDTVFTLVKVFVDYIKTPQYIRLTQEQVNLTEDTSQIMEFPDYVCQEIINELTTLVMENTADPRLQTHIPVTQTIANPAQQQPQTQSK